MSYALKAVSLCLRVSVFNTSHSALKIDESRCQTLTLKQTGNPSHTQTINRC